MQRNYTRSIPQMKLKSKYSWWLNKSELLLYPIIIEDFFFPKYTKRNHYPICTYLFLQTENNNEKKKWKQQRRRQQHDFSVSNAKKLPNIHWLIVSYRKWCGIGEPHWQQQHSQLLLAFVHTTTKHNSYQWLVASAEIQQTIWRYCSIDIAI